MASPVWQVAASTTNATAGTSLVITKPTGVVEGDLMIAVLTLSGDTSFTVIPSGWTVIRNVANGTNVRHSVYWKVAGASEPADYTWEWTASVRNAGSIHRITGAHATTPIEGSATSATGTDAAPNPPSYTPGSSQDYLFVATFGQSAKNNSSTPPTNYTERTDLSTTGAGPNNAHAASSTATRALTTGTAEDPGTFTSGTSEAWVANTIAIQPPAGGPSPQTISVNASTETETAEPVGIAGQLIAVAESEVAQTVAAQATISVSVGGAIETETAEPVGIANQIVAVSESEAAQAITTQTVISVSVGGAVETEAAQVVTPTQPAGSQNISVNASSETEAAGSVTFARSLVQARPDADNDKADWDSAPTPSQDLFAQIDEAITDDADYIFVEVLS